jgi:methionine--tRNA ligase beta chain
MSVTFRDFEKLSLKVGRIATAEKIPGFTKIMKVEVDIGERRMQAIAGGAQYYSPQVLSGKRVIVITNMESKTITGIKSEVMLLAADLNGKPIWLTVEGDVPAGTTVR